MERNDEALDDWRDLILSPKALFPVSISDPNYFTESLPESAAWADDFSHIDVAMFDPDHIKLEEDQNVDTSTPASASASVVAKTDSAGTNGQTIADRRAATLGFNVSKIRSAAPSSCLTLPPGINPTLLLDSPVMVPNSQSSPTTGTLVLPNHDKPMFDSPSLGINKDNTSGDESPSFRVRSPPVAGSSPCYSNVQSQNPSATDLAQSALESRNLASIQAQSALKHCDATLKNMVFDSPLKSNIQLDSSTMKSNSEPFHPSHSYGVGGRELKNDNEAALVVNTGAAYPSNGNHKALCPSIGAAAKTSEDGYNWRKYGQKQVKGSEYPRSYYKCTHLSCLVKKKVERSHDGEITEIIYKGAHNHPKPQPSRRSTFGSALSSFDSSNNGEAKDESSALWRDFQNGYNKDIKVGSDGLEITLSTSVLTELSDPYWNQGKAMSAFESAEAPELSSTLASHDEDDDDDKTTPGSVSLGEDDDDDESDAKRRRKEVSVIGTVLGSRAVREPRVVVQIESEIDILDDGYRWRKYGQKVVKGNPNPRSYYKCTSAGCVVRKHVERASHDLKYVITTYEGKHNHQVPAARNSSGHANSGGGNVLPPGSSSQASSLALPRNPHPKPEPQDFIPHFDRKVEYSGNQLLRSNYIGNLSGGGASSFYPLKFPALTNPILYGSFGMNHPNNPSPVLPHPGVEDLPVSLPLNFPLPLNLSVGNFSRPPVRPMNMVPPPLFMSPQAKENDVKLLRPKPEQRDESFGDSSLAAIDHNSGSASMYHGMMCNFPS